MPPAMTARRISRMFCRMTRITSAAVRPPPDDDDAAPRGPAAVAGMASGPAGIGRGTRMGAVCGSVVIEELLRQLQKNLPGVSGSLASHRGQLKTCEA